jgi:WD40 repeat protein
MISYENENILNLIFNSITLLNFKYALEIFNKTLHRIIYKNLSHKLFLESLGNSKITFTGQKGLISSLIPFKENSIITSSFDSSINIWDINTKTVIKTIKALYSVCSLLILPNGNLASACVPSIDIWDLNNDFELIKTLTFNSFRYFVNLIMLTNNNFACIANYGVNDHILIFNSFNYSLVQTLSGHSSRINTLAAISSETFASSSGDGSIKIWKFGNDEFLLFEESGYKNIHTLVNEKGIGFIAVSNKADLLLSVDIDYSIKLWDLKSYECIKKIGFNSKSNYITCGVFIRNRFFAYGTKYGDIRVFDVLDDDNNECIKLLKCSSKVASLMLWKDYRIISGTYDGQIILWDYQLR